MVGLCFVAALTLFAGQFFCGKETTHNITKIVLCSVMSGEQGWRSGERARLLPMRLGFGRFDSRSRCHMWVEFVVGSRPCSERFFPGYSGFPLSSKTNISKFQFNLGGVPN